jgi:peroxiredoxin
MNAEEKSSKQRAVLITGASSGFGAVTASLLAERGYRVFGTSRNPGRNRTQTYEMFPLDVRSDDSVRTCIQGLIKRTGRLDVLISNAGYELAGAVEETSIDEAKEQLDVNFFGTVRMVKAALPVMRKQGGGRILLISSLAGLLGVPFQGFYSASKYALEGYAGLAPRVKSSISAYRLSRRVLQDKPCALGADQCGDHRRVRRMRGGPAGVRTIGPGGGGPGTGGVTDPLHHREQVTAAPVPGREGCETASADQSARAGGGVRGGRTQELSPRRIGGHMKKIIVFITVALLVGTVGAQPLIDYRAPEFTLQDLYERTVSLKQYEGRVVVLIASDKEGKTQNTAWLKAVRDKYADRVAIQGIADVSSVPFFLKGKIRGDFKKDVDSILLDWKGEVFKAYGLTKGVSNVILIGKDGMVRHRTSGRASPEAVQELFRKIDALH